MRNLKNLKKKNGTNIYDQQIKDEEKLFNETKKSLKKYQSATDDGLKKVTLTWQDNLDKQLSEITGSNFEFKDAGNGTVQMYIDGVVQGKPKSKEEMAKLVQSTILEISKQKTGAETAGKDLLDGLNNGIGNERKQQGIFGKITTFGQTLLSKLKSSLQEHSPSKATEEMGVNLIKGMNNGIDKIKTTTIKLLNKLGTSMLKTISNNIKNVSTAGKDLITSFDKGVTSAIKSTEKNVKKVIDNYFSNLQSENEKQQKKLQKQIDNTSDKTKKKNLQTKLKTLKDQNKEIKNLYNNFGKTAISQFNSALETATNGTTDKLKEKIQTLSDTMQKEIDNVNSKIASMKDKLSDYGGLFTTTTTNSGKQVYKLTDINKQIQTLETYNKNLTSLKGKVSDNLINEIANMNVDDAIKYSDKLLKMSKTDLKKYNDAYTKKINLANSISNNFYADKIAEIKKNYTDKMTSEFEKARKEIEKIGTNTLKGFIKGMKKSDYTKDIKKVAQNIIKTMKKELKINSPSKVFEGLGEFSGQGYINGLAESLKGVKANISNMVGNLQKSSNTINNKSISNSNVSYFTQNNYSPKPLSRIELYRQSKNLLNFAKGG